MGIFKTYNYTRGNQKISARFLKNMGFHQARWGSPMHHDKGSIMWEKTIFETDIDETGRGDFTVAQLWYFPETFTGYVTSFNSNGKNPAGAITYLANSSAINFHLGVEKARYPKTKMDIICYIDEITEKIKHFN